MDPATILWVLGRVCGILSGLSDGILWPTWGSSGPLGTNRDERAGGSQNGPEDPRRARGSQPRPHEPQDPSTQDATPPRKLPRPQVPGRTGHRIPARKVVARYAPSDAIADGAVIAIAGAAVGALRGQIRAPGAPHFSKRVGYQEPIRRATT